MNDAPDPFLGTLLGGRYRVNALLGRGGMGAVYDGTQEDLRRRVAIKVIHTNVIVDANVFQRFQREAYAAAALGHPNIVKVIDFQANPNEPPFLVMEHVLGRSLRRLLAEEGKLTAPRMVAITQQLLSALAIAHAARIVHRDIKPDNIMISATLTVPDFVTLLDFGIAKVLDGSAPLSQSGAMIGTLSYMAPEQAMGGTVDERADLYAVGACMYMALTGRHVFDGRNQSEVLASILTSPVTPLISLRPDLDPRMCAVLERALEKDPTARFANATEMANALAPWSTTPAPAPRPATLASYAPPGVSAPPTVTAEPTQTPYSTSAGPPTVDTSLSSPGVPSVAQPLVAYQPSPRPLHNASYGPPGSGSPGYGSPGYGSPPPVDPTMRSGARTGSSTAVVLLAVAGVIVAVLGVAGAVGAWVYLRTDEHPVATRAVDAGLDARSATLVTANTVSAPADGGTAVIASHKPIPTHGGTVAGDAGTHTASTSTTSVATTPSTGSTTVVPAGVGGLAWDKVLFSVGKTEGVTLPYDEAVIMKKLSTKDAQVQNCRAKARPPAKEGDELAIMLHIGFGNDGVIFPSPLFLAEGTFDKCVRDLFTGMAMGPPRSTNPNYWAMVFIATARKK